MSTSILTDFAEVHCRLRTCDCFLNCYHQRFIFQDTWFPVRGEGGYTITHSEDGEAIHTTVVMLDTQKTANKAYVTKPKPVKLIYCSRFTKSKPVSFCSFYIWAFTLKT
jgi:hypothetical protein